MIARVAGAELDPPEASPLEEAAGSILVAAANRLSGKLAELIEASLDRAIAWLKRKPGESSGSWWPFGKKAPKKGAESDGRVPNGSGPEVVVPGE